MCVCLKLCDLHSVMFSFLYFVFLIFFAVRTHGETTTQSTTSITITTASLTEPGSTGGVGGDVAMDAEDAKPPQAGSDM